MMKVTNTPRNKRTSKGMTAVTHTKLARKELPICLRVLATISESYACNPCEQTHTAGPSAIAPSCS
eukprot:COSAG01_NODE_21332_length_907_cov_0.793317_2_plen_65_part_01